MTRVHKEIAPGVWLDAAPALWFEEARVLVVADLHWGYARSQRAQGRLFPEWGDQHIDARLRTLLEAYQPGTMIWLGDTLHTIEGRDEAERFLAGIDIPTVILRGNHDRNWSAVTEISYQIGPYFLHHGDQELDVPAGAVEIIGHFHPAITLGDGAGLSLKMPALIQGPRRWILPAFSPWAAGVDWKKRLEAEEIVWIASPKRVFRWIH